MFSTKSIVIVSFVLVVAFSLSKGVVGEEPTPTTTTTTGAATSSSPDTTQISTQNVSQNGTANATDADTTANPKSESVTTTSTDAATSTGTTGSTTSPDTTTSTGATTSADPVIVKQDNCSSYTNITECCEGAGKIDFCHFCQGANSTNNTCRVECEGKEANTCAVSPPTASSATSTPTAHSTSTTGQTTNTHKNEGIPSSQSFDAASFIGGIILAGGLITIAFFGLRFYKARKEQNYHTL